MSQRYCRLWPGDKRRCISDLSSVQHQHNHSAVPQTARLDSTAGDRQTEGQDRPTDPPLAYSPDLNIIESVWSTLQDMIAKTTPKTTAETCHDLLGKTEGVWWQIDQDYIQHLYHTIPNRCRMEIEEEGRITKYLVLSNVDRPPKASARAGAHCVAGRFRIA